MIKLLASIGIALASVLSSAVTSQSADSQGPTTSAKHVRVLATGGTIAGAGQGSGPFYRAGVVPIGDILRTIPGLNAAANVTAEQVANVGSFDMNEALWLKLLSRVQVAVSDPQVSGVVITHGTDTLEETAYFLSLVVPSSKPVVIVGSMRPGTAVSADGPQNLLDAVRVASDDRSRNRGVMVVMNDTIFDPASVTKVDIRRMNAFAAPSRGPVGDVLTDSPKFFSVAEAHDAAFTVTAEKLPRVAIVYAYAGIRGEDVLSASRGAKGLIIAGVGAGGSSAGAREVVKQLTSKGMPVVRTARQGAGDVWRNDSPLGDTSDKVLGTIAGRELTPGKARILLMLALQKPRSPQELQDLFDRYGTGEH